MACRTFVRPHWTVCIFWVIPFWMDTEQSHGRLGAGTRAVDGSGHRCGTNECSGCSGCTEKQLFLTEKGAQILKIWPKWLGKTMSVWYPIGPRTLGLFFVATLALTIASLARVVEWFIVSYGSRSMLSPIYNYCAFHLRHCLV